MGDLLNILLALVLAFTGLTEALNVKGGSYNGKGQRNVKIATAIFCMITAIRLIYHII